MKDNSVARGVRNAEYLFQVPTHAIKETVLRWFVCDAVDKLAKTDGCYHALTEAALAAARTYATNPSEANRRALSSARHPAQGACTFSQCKIGSPEHIYLQAGYEVACIRKTGCSTIFNYSLLWPEGWLLQRFKNIYERYAACGDRFLWLEAEGKSPLQEMVP